MTPNPNPNGAGIVTPPEEEGLSARVWTKDRTLGLSMARSLGDHELAKYGVIPTPVVTKRQMKPNDSVMILATDGIWEFITSQQAMDIVSKFPDDATAACRELILEATKRSSSRSVRPHTTLYTAVWHRRILSAAPHTTCAACAACSDTVVYKVA